MTDDCLSLLNYVANLPEVLPFIAPGFENLDFTCFFNNPRNVMLGDESGLVIFAYLSDGTYEGHYLLTHNLPAAKRLPFLRQCLMTLFTKHCASAIRGRTPHDNRAARIVNHALGFRPIGSATDMSGRPCTYYVLERDTWARLSAASSEQPAP